VSVIARGATVREFVTVAVAGMQPESFTPIRPEYFLGVMQFSACDRKLHLSGTGMEENYFARILMTLSDVAHGRRYRK
jgi:hypothetical protein